MNEHGTVAFKRYVELSFVMCTNRMTTVFERDDVHVHLVGTSEPRIRILRIDVSEVPTGDALEALNLATAAFLRSCEGRIVIHARHVQSDELKPPDMTGLMSIVGKLFELKEVVDAKLKGTIVQCKRLDDIVVATKNLFLTLYKPKREFDIVTSEQEVETFLERILAHEADKRERRNGVQYNR